MVVNDVKAASAALQPPVLCECRLVRVLPLLGAGCLCGSLPFWCRMRA